MQEGIVYIANEKWKKLGVHKHRAKWLSGAKQKRLRCQAAMSQIASTNSFGSNSGDLGTVCSKMHKKYPHSTYCAKLATFTTASLEDDIKRLDVLLEAFLKPDAVTCKCAGKEAGDCVLCVYVAFFSFGGPTALMAMMSPQYNHPGFNSYPEIRDKLAEIQEYMLKIAWCVQSFLEDESQSKKNLKPPQCKSAGVPMPPVFVKQWFFSTITFLCADGATERAIAVVSELMMGKLAHPAKSKILDVAFSTRSAIGEVRLLPLLMYAAVRSNIKNAYRTLEYINVLIITIDENSLTFMSEKGWQQLLFGFMTNQDLYMPPEDGKESTNADQIEKQKLSVIKMAVNCFGHLMHQHFLHLDDSNAAATLASSRVDGATPKAKKKRMFDFMILCFNLLEDYAGWNLNSVHLTNVLLLTLCLRISSTSRLFAMDPCHPCWEGLLDVLDMSVNFLFFSPLAKNGGLRPKEDRLFFDLGLHMNKDGTSITLPLVKAINRLLDGLPQLSVDTFNRTEEKEAVQKLARRIESEFLFFRTAANYFEGMGKSGNDEGRNARLGKKIMRLLEQRKIGMQKVHAVVSKNLKKKKTFLTSFGNTNKLHAAELKAQETAKEAALPSPRGPAEGGRQARQSIVNTSFDKSRMLGSSRRQGVFNMGKSAQVKNIELLAAYTSEENERQSLLTQRRHQRHPSSRGGPAKATPQTAKPGSPALAPRVAKVAGVGIPATPRASAMPSGQTAAGPPRVSLPPIPGQKIATPPRVNLLPQPQPPPRVSVVVTPAVAPATVVDNTPKETAEPPPTTSPDAGLDDSLVSSAPEDEAENKTEQPPPTPPEPSIGDQEPLPPPPAVESEQPPPPDDDAPPAAPSEDEAHTASAHIDLAREPIPEHDENEEAPSSPVLGGIGGMNMTITVDSEAAPFTLTPAETSTSHHPHLAGSDSDEDDAEYASHQEGGMMANMEEFTLLSCKVCDKLLTDAASSFEKMGENYCEEHYTKLFCSCMECEAPVADNVGFVTVPVEDSDGNKTDELLYHLKHYQCYECKGGFFDGAELQNETIHPYNRRIYCKRDFYLKFGKACDFCHEGIGGPSVSAMGGHFHGHHFYCAGLCGRTLDTLNLQYYPVEMNDPVYVNWLASNASSQPNVWGKIKAYLKAQPKDEDEHHDDEEEDMVPFCIEDYSVVFAPTCYACKKKITDNTSVSITGELALGAVEFHAACFSCSVDGCDVTSSSDVPIFFDEGKLMCQTHIDDQGPACTNCHLTIQTHKETSVSVREQPYHTKCVRCAVCDILLEEEVFIMEGVNPILMCKQHFVESKAPRCTSCGLPVATGGVKLSGQVYHKDCVVCKTCNQPLKQVRRSPEDAPLAQQGIYCQDHWAELFKSHHHTAAPSVYDGPVLCPMCNELVTGGHVFKVGNERYHKDCFHCAECKEGFPDKQFARDKNTHKFYHRDHLPK